MASIIARTALDPLVTGSLLWLLLRGPERVRAKLLDALAASRFGIDTPKRILKILIAFGVVRRLSKLLDTWSNRNWQLAYTGRPWIWPDEVAVITGGSGDIASALVRKLAATGMKIALLDLQPPPADIAAMSNVGYYKCNIASSQAIREAAAEIRLDLGIPTILVNNAGVGTPSNIIKVTDEALERTFHVNIMSHWYTVREFLPGMIKAKKGHVMTTASMASYVGVAGMADYCVTKAGALSFHETLTQEIRHRYNAPYIYTTSVHPHWVQTAMTEDLEGNLKKAGEGLMSAEYVGGEMFDAIMSKKSGHLILPRSSVMMRLGTAIRGWPTWLNTLVNDKGKDIMRFD
jgi:all-trans-retinol dehydrogenase (NAD+)